MNISGQLIYEAISYYEKLGYKMIDVPLVVDSDVSKMTKPRGVPDLGHLGGKVYVASAEQSFIQLHKEGKLYKGKYMALTPCYRHEPVLDESHFLMFLKLELIEIGTHSVYPLLDAQTFFSKKLTGVSQWGNLINDGCDIMHNNTELGSYGFRTMIDGTPYTYGTGIAEPRFSAAIRDSL